MRLRRVTDGAGIRWIQAVQDRLHPSKIPNRCCLAYRSLRLIQLDRALCRSDRIVDLLLSECRHELALDLSVRACRQFLQDLRYVSITHASGVFAIQGSLPPPAPKPSK